MAERQERRNWMVVVRDPVTHEALASYRRTTHRDAEALLVQLAAGTHARCRLDHDEVFPLGAIAEKRWNGTVFDESTVRLRP